LVVSGVKVLTVVTAVKGGRAEMATRVSLVEQEALVVMVVEEALVAREDMVAMEAVF
jgi:hypothetical protein